jgi:hypothetical protein
LLHQLILELEEERRISPLSLWGVQLLCWPRQTELTGGSELCAGDFDRAHDYCGYTPGSHDKSLLRIISRFCLRKHGFLRRLPASPCKHSKNFSLTSALSIGVDAMQRNFDGMRTQVEAWQGTQLADVRAKLIIYEAFIEAHLEVPRHLGRTVHGLYFNPQYEEFQPRTLWSLSNAFTSAFKELEPIPQFKATARLAGFLDAAP